MRSAKLGRKKAMLFIFLLYIISNNLFCLSLNTTIQLSYCEIKRIIGRSHQKRQNRLWLLRSLTTRRLQSLHTNLSNQSDRKGGSFKQQAYIIIIYTSVPSSRFWCERPVRVTQQCTSDRVTGLMNINGFLKQICLT